MNKELIRQLIKIAVSFYRVANLTKDDNLRIALFGCYRGAICCAKEVAKHKPQQEPIVIYKEGEADDLDA
jgi:hypothetical protein